MPDGEDADDLSGRDRERRLLRLGTVRLLLASVCVLGFRPAHGDLPTDTGEAALRCVAAGVGEAGRPTITGLRDYPSP